MKARFAVVILILSTAALTITAHGQPPALLWTFDAPDLIRSSPAIATDGTVYLGAGANLYAITNRGSNAWIFPTASFIQSSPCVAADGTIYLSSDQLYAINPTGSQRWAYPAHCGAGSPGLGFDGTIYVTGGRWLQAISSVGSSNWANAFLLSQTKFLSPALYTGGLIYVASFDDSKLYAVNASGASTWTFTFYEIPGDSPAVGADGTVYFTGGPLYAFSRDGTNIWTSQTNFFKGSSPAIGSDGTIFVPNAGGSLCAFSRSGQFQWQVLTNGPRAGTTVAIDSAGTIYSLAYSVLYAISPGGTVQWSIPLIPDPSDQFATSYTSPTIAPDGTIYVTSANRLYAFAGTNGLADSPWPMYRQNARHTGKIERPFLQQPRKLTDASLEFELYAQVGGTQTVQASTDLLNWSFLTNASVTNVPIDVVDLSASNFPSRFYRTVSQ
jgi:hypothetical protein